MSPAKVARRRRRLWGHVSHGRSFLGGAGKEVLKAVKAFRGVGAECRKVRGEDKYVCSLGDVKSEITPYGIKVRVLGEFRLDYSRFSLEDDAFIRDDDILDMIKEESGADNTYIDIPSTSLYLVLEYGLRNAEKAAEVARKLHDKNLYIVITNVTGDIRLIKNYDVAKLNEWLNSLSE